MCLSTERTPNGMPWGLGVYEFVGTGNDQPRRVDIDNSGSPISTCILGSSGTSAWSANGNMISRRRTHARLHSRRRLRRPQPARQRNLGPRRRHHQLRRLRLPVHPRRLQRSRRRHLPGCRHRRLPRLLHHHPATRQRRHRPDQRPLRLRPPRRQPRRRPAKANPCAALMQVSGAQTGGRSRDRQRGLRRRLHCLVHRQGGPRRQRRLPQRESGRRRPQPLPLAHRRLPPRRADDLPRQARFQ